ncbi:hypothetical protein JCM5353_001972 [Sporobolomyces roseus]
MLPILPFDILIQIFQHLDPLYNNETSLIDTPSSSLALQRSLGSTLSLLSQDWRPLGSRYLWTNFILSFAKENSRKKLVLLIGNEEIAKQVKRLWIYANIHDVERAVGVPIEFLLPSVNSLHSLELTTTPSFAQRLFSQLDLSNSPDGNLANLRHLTLDTSYAESPHYPSFLLGFLRRLPHLTSLKIMVQLSASGVLPPPPPTPAQSQPLRHLTSLNYLVSDTTFGQSPLAIPLLASLLELVDPTPLTSLRISSRSLPDTLSQFISSAPSLTSLKIASDRLTIERDLPLLLSPLPSLSRLSQFEIGILPAWTAPFHLLSNSPLVPLLFSTLTSCPILQSISLDFDLTSHESQTREYLRRAWDGGRLRMFEWNAWTAVARERVEVTYERRDEGGWRREEEGNSIEIVGI